MQHQYKTGSIIVTFVFLGLTSRDLNMHFPRLSFNQAASASSGHTMLAQNQPSPMVIKK